MAGMLNYTLWQVPVGTRRCISVAFAVQKLGLFFTYGTEFVLFLAVLGLTYFIHFVNYNIHTYNIVYNQHLQLCTARTAVSDSVIRSAKIG